MKTRFHLLLNKRQITLVITLLISGATFYHLCIFASAESQKVTSGFPTVYTAARLWLSGIKGANLQDWNWFRERVASHGFTSTDVFWGNPPSLSLLFVPLAWLSPGRARIVWTVLSLLAWFAGVEWLRRTVMPGRDRLSAWIEGLFLAAFAALYDPFQANLHLAQIYSVLFFFACATCVLWLRGKPLAAGIFAGMMLAFKGYGLLFIVLALFRRDRRMLIGAAASFAFLAGLACLRLGTGSWLDFLSIHLWDSSFSGTAVPALQTMKSFAGVAMLPAYHPGGIPPVLSKTANLTLSALGMAIQIALVLWFVRNAHKPYSIRRSDTGYLPPTQCILAACIALDLIFSPHAENHAYCLALAGFLLMIPALSRLNIVSAFLVLAGLLLGWPFNFQTRPVLDKIDLLAAYPRLWGAVLVLMVALMVRIAHRKKKRKPQLNANSVAGYAWLLGLSLLVFNTKLWSQTTEGPLLIVSRPKANAVSLFRLDSNERDSFSIPVSCTGPFGIAADHDRRWLYATCTDDSKLSIIDFRSHQESRALDAPRMPAWATLRPGAREVWISNEAMGTVTIYESGTATALAEVETGSGPSDICFTSNGETAFVSNEASGTISWIDASLRRKILDIRVGKVPQGLALTPDGRTLVVANYGSDAVSLVSLVEQREVARINTGRGPVDVVVSSSGRGYITCFEDGAISVLDLKKQKEKARLTVGNHVFGIAAHPSKKRLYVCSAGTDELIVLRESSKPKILKRIRIQGSPTLLTIAP